MEKRITGINHGQFSIIFAHFLKLNNKFGNFIGEKVVESNFIQLYCYEKKKVSLKFNYKR